MLQLHDLNLAHERKLEGKIIASFSPKFKTSHECLDLSILDFCSSILYERDLDF